MNKNWYLEAKNENIWMNWRYYYIKKLIKSQIKKKIMILDIGCGEGIVGEKIFNDFKIKTFACDKNKQATKKINKKKINLIHYNINMKKKKFKNKFDIILMLDVIEHIKNDKRFLNDSLFHLKKGGIAIINVPAVNSLYSKYDKLIGHIKRYKKQDLTQIINKNENKILKHFYWGISLIPVLIIRKIMTDYILKFNSNDEVIEFGWKTGFFSKFMLKILSFERYLNINFPIGSSLMCVIRKQK